MMVFCRSFLGFMGQTIIVVGGFCGMSWLGYIRYGVFRGVLGVILMSLGLRVRGQVLGEIDML